MLKAYTTASFFVALDLVSLGCSPSSGRVVRAGSTDSGGSSNSNPGGGTTSNIVPNQDGGYIVSTSGGSGGVGGGTDCGRSNFPVAQKPADMLLVLDRSSSMVQDSIPTKWANVVPALHGVIDATASSLWWGLKVFPVGTDAQCTPGTYPSGVVVNIAANNASAMDTAIDATLPTGNGTPTSDAINEAVIYLQTLQDGNPKYIVLATDGEPSCFGMTGSTTLARQGAIDAVGAAATAGFHTFVVGVATSKDTASATLNGMAKAGLEPLPPTSATSYYMASTQSALVSAFNSITSVVKTCLFPVSKPPPDPGHVNVSVDTTRIAFDPARANGWNFTGSDMLTIQLYGTACDLATSSGAAAVQVVFGCANDILIIT